MYSNENWTGMARRLTVRRRRMGSYVASEELKRKARIVQKLFCGPWRRGSVLEKKRRKGCFEGMGVAGYKVQRGRRERGREK